MRMSETTLLRYARHEPLPRPALLRAGPLTMSFDPSNGFIRHLRVGDHEVVRAVYAAVRDQNWATIAPQISNISSEIAKDFFRITFDVVCREREIDYFWRGHIAGDSSGKVVYKFEGESKSQFLRNRIGLCVLHPIVECAGKPCTVEHVDGSRKEGAFPQNISPQQPFFDIRAITYPIATTGGKVEIRFDGEAFEMEDQRNWGDASFKTYSTPQRLPKPAPVKPGDKVQHTVSIGVAGLTRPILPVVQGRAPQFSIATTDAIALPPLGLCAPAEGLRVNHLRVDLDLQGEFSPVLEQAARSGLNLHIALTVAAAAELERLQEALDRIKPRVSLWLLYARGQMLPTEDFVRAAQRVLHSYAPNALIAAGTREWFVEWNHARPSKDFPALIAFAAHPQIHQPDNVTMVENLAGIAYQADSAKEFSTKPVVYSPISLGPSGDPREASLFGAAWILGSIARLAETGNVHSLTYSMKLAEGQRVVPAYHVISDIIEFGATKVFVTHSTHPLLTDGLTLVNAHGARRVLLANYTDDSLEVKIKTGQVKARVRCLDETNCRLAMDNSVEFGHEASKPVESVSGKIELKLLPYAIARVDLLT